MDWFSNILNYIKVKTGLIKESSERPVDSNATKPLLSPKKTSHPSEITFDAGIPDSQIERQHYLKETKNADYIVKKGDNLDKIANKYGVSVKSLMALNSLDEKSILNLNQVLKIPSTKRAQNIKSVSDVAKCLGVSQDFVKSLKRLEDGGISMSTFHNDVYTDNAGVKTIGIGHRWQQGEPTHLSNAQVLELYANDLLKMEDNLVAIFGKQKYDKFPQAMKEALLDMTFNKGTSIITEDKDLMYRLNNGKFEAAVNCLTNNKSVETKQEMSGLSKRRLFDMSLAFKMYNGGKIPSSNIAKAQEVYNRGIDLLRAECKKNNLNFLFQLSGFNKDVQGFLGDKISYVKE